MSGLRVKLYLATRKRLLQAFALQQAVFEGFWLGVLGRKHLNALDQHCFDIWRNYHAEDYNLSGLNAWEARAIESHFGGARRIFLLAAGGGRELIALAKLGYQVDAYECHPDLIAFGNRLLETQGMKERIIDLPRDILPPLEAQTKWDAAIIGWSAYMHIQGRDKRVGLLRGLRDRLPPGGPVLLSFFELPQGNRRYRLSARIANGLRWLRREERVDVGDRLVPNFAHCFTRDSLNREVMEAGLELALYDEKDYAHAVARVPLAPAVTNAR